MGRGRRLRGWRKIAASTWGRPTDPQIYGDLEVDATAALEFIADAREAGHHLTITHVAGRALAHAFAENPDLNGRLFRGRYVQRESIDIFFIVSAEQGRELSGVKVDHADRRSAVEIAAELRERATRIHTGEDEEFGRTKALLERVPPRILRVMLRVSAWLAIDLDLDLRALGVERQTFGSAMISSVGMFGIQHAYAPLSPYYRVPLLVLVGEVQQRPAVREGVVMARPIVELNATLDHRSLDGYHAGRLAHSIQAYLADPTAFEPALEA
jgi:pyruvate/2-oxoglutarate dehydrogenase complex dihydrolipoamide acyltransferase (E2) component